MSVQLRETPISLGDRKRAMMIWKGTGFCKSRHHRKENDYCNNPVVKGGEYCYHHTCSVLRCKEPAGCWWPMLGDYRLCSKHNIPKYRPEGSDD